MSVIYFNQPLNPSAGVISKDRDIDYVPAMLTNEYIISTTECSKCKQKKMFFEFPKRYYSKKNKPKWATVNYQFRKQCKKCYNAQRNRRRHNKKLYASMIQSLTVPTDLSREEIFELGRRAPYYRFVEFPIEFVPSLPFASIEVLNGQ